MKYARIKVAIIEKMSIGSEACEKGLKNEFNARNTAPKEKAAKITDTTENLRIKLR